MFRRNREALLLPLLLILLACSTFNVDAPTATPPLDSAPTLRPSPTVLPVIPENSDADFIGRSNPTAAGLAAEAQPFEDMTPVALPTEAMIPYTLVMADGTLLTSELYGAPLIPAPLILLVHGESGEIAALQALALAMQVQGYHVLVLTLRGYGRSNGVTDWAQADEDIVAALQNLDSLETVTAIFVGGAGTGAISSAAACITYTPCAGVILLNPLVREDTPPLDTIISTATQRPPMLLVLGEDQPAAGQVAQILDARLTAIHESIVFPTLNLGDLTRNTVPLQIHEWLSERLTPSP